LDSQALPIPAVIGGTDAHVLEIPWQGGIQFEFYWGIHFPFCGGTIIGPSTILTAAHCLTDNSSNVLDFEFKVMVAEHDYTTETEANTK
jgi:secreted trypsin-like serine protease